MKCNYPCIGDDTSQCGTIIHDSTAIYKIYNKKRRLITDSNDFNYYINQMTKAAKQKIELREMTDIQLKNIQYGDNTIPSTEHSTMEGNLFKLVEAIDSFVVC